MKKLEVTNEKACIGCDLCVLLASSLDKNLSIVDSPIDVKKVDDGYKVTIDPAKELNVKQIVNICPTGVFSEVNDKK